MKKNEKNRMKKNQIKNMKKNEILCNISQRMYHRSSTHSAVSRFTLSCAVSSAFSCILNEVLASSSSFWQATSCSRCASLALFSARYCCRSSPMSPFNAPMLALERRYRSSAFCCSSSTSGCWASTFNCCSSWKIRPTASRSSSW